MPGFGGALLATDPDFFALTQSCSTLHSHQTGCVLTYPFVGAVTYKFGAVSSLDLHAGISRNRLM